MHKVLITGIGGNIGQGVLKSLRASENSLVLGQTRTDAKSNEITAIPELLQLLDVSGCIVTIDAMGCQKEMARTILDRGADYLPAVKENQGRLYEDIRDLFEGHDAEEEIRRLKAEDEGF